MSDYRLIYFDGRGRAEIVRLIFAAAGVDFEDVRLSTREQWLQLKPKTPFGQLPVLETQGEMFYQSLSIARYLARKFGLAGKTGVEEVKVDSMVDAIEDIMRPIPQFWRYETDEQKKEALKKVYLEETLPSNLNNLEKLLKSNRNGDGYFVGESLTWSDLHLLNLLAMLEVQVQLTDPFDKHPKLKALAQRVSAQTPVAGYLAKRPPSTF